MKKIKIFNYLNNSFLNYIFRYYKKNIKKQIIIEISYFYWLFENEHIRNIKGLCVSMNSKRYNNMESFLLYYKYKNVKINQLYFITSPFNLFLKFKVSKTKKYKLYIL